MADKVFVIIADADREKALEVSLIYPLNCNKNT
jgi:hypothetical protein